ncbi:hypothetical protein LTR91_011524 [Friedmanniomyces endolithicus]|uniref:RanBD1 domain-containing protein n=1 Tax=Friedmanniomyces endolithicus TaxID=329885 RepID=A0AAN6KI02_9PEZI|nr:hypothetical protein LTR57_006140 [Friedmanniomyces endolithicus]KAK0982498.1 hypothetical protein LTR91_011524 [Friedmanniomyces endolithicus]KAK0998786.1 hypothetical protein LTS01_005613 [Friedmanniomyces endolithicus]KAK1040893.1 hypothetical protein LTS16_010008 [Friedmanniomyces endolithicus]
MSKRGMESQGGEDRYGNYGLEGGPSDGPVDKPVMATAAQIAQRRIKEAKRKTPRGSRAGSPAVTVTGQGATGTNPFQSFQPPPSANTFSFSLPGAPVPSFSKPVPQQNGSMSAANQPNGALSFGGFGNTQVNGAPSFGSNNAQPQTNGFTSFNFGTQTQPNTTSTPSTSFSFGQSATTSQEQPKQNGFNPSTTSVFGARDGVQAQQPQINGETPKPNSFAGVFGNVPQTNGAAPAIGTGMFGSIPASSVTAAPAQGIFSGLNAASASTVRPGMFSDTQASQNGERSQAQTPQPATLFAPPPQTNGAAPTLPNGGQSKEPQQPIFSFGQNFQPNTAVSSNTSNMFGAPNTSSAPEAEKPAMKFSFSQPPQTNGVHADTSKAGNMFTGAFGQSTQDAPETAKKPSATSGTDFFSGAGQQKLPETPFKFGPIQSRNQQTPTQNFFGSFAQPQATGVPQQEDTSMLTPGSTPHKQNLAASQSEQSFAQREPEAETPANPNLGKSIFDRISRDPPATVNKPTFMFSSMGATDSQTEQAPNPNAGKSLLERMTPRDPVPPATAPKAPSAPLFSITAPTPTAPDRPAVNTQPSAMAATSTIDNTAAPDRQKLKMLNEGILSHLNNEDPNQDWSRIMQFYLDQAAKLMGREAVKAPIARAPAMQPPMSSTASSAPRPAPTSLISETPTSALFGGAFAKPSASSGGSSSQPGMVHAMAPAPPGQSTRAPQPATPQSSVSSMFSHAAIPPATAPVNRKRSADNELTKGATAFEAPATEKRTKPNASVDYPSLPVTASNTAKLFASTLDKPATITSPNFGPSNDLMAKVREQKAAKEAAQRDDQTEKAAPAPSAFKPSTTFHFGASGASSPAVVQPAETPEAPKFAFKPAAPASSNTLQTPAFKPSTKFNFGSFSAAAKPAEKQAETPQAASTAFKPSTTFKFSASPDKPAEAPKTPSFGFKPAPADSATNPLSGGPNFLSAFGKKAETSIADAKRKRMDADYDSEEEDKAAWLTRDEAKQLVKKQKIDEAIKSASFGFKPTPAEDTPPSVAGPALTFKPIAAPAGGNNFLSVFGKKAEESVAEAKRKRFDEDYDSDDDGDQDAWEAKDREKQEAKRQKIEEAIKSAPGFRVPSTATGEAAKAPPVFKLPGLGMPAETSTKPAGEDAAESPNPNAGKSIFDRITFPAKTTSTTSLFSPQTASKDSTATTPSFFKHSNASGAPAIKFGAATPTKGANNTVTEAESQQGQGNNTWNPNTPIKFGATNGTESTTPAAAPPSNIFGGLFGPNAAASNSSKLAPPPVGFTFGAPKGISADISRATSPGITTDGEASAAGDGPGNGDGEPSDQANEKQVEDMTALMDEELEAEDVLFQVPIAKTMKLSREGGGAASWVEKGKGPLYILKNKSTGRTRVVMKIAPLGRLAMNFSPLAGFGYKCAAGKRTLQATFVDHFEKGEGGRPSSWTIQVREAKDAQVIAGILEEEKA